MKALGPTLILAATGVFPVAASDVVSPVVAVTASRFPDTYLDKPTNLTVIDRPRIDTSAATSVPQLLAQEAGFSTHDFFGGNTASTTVDLRGFGITGGQNTLILLDGRRLSDIDLSGVQWSALPLHAVERIEVIRGAGGAVLYGDQAVAGVVNIITRSPYDLSALATLGGGAGSQNAREAHAEVSTSSHSAGLRVYGTHFESDGYRANNRNLVTDTFADLRWRGAASELALKLGTDRQDLQLPGARTVQPSVGLDQWSTDPRGTSTPLDRSTRNGNHAALELDHHFEAFDLNLGGGFRNKFQTAYFDFGGFPNYSETQTAVWSFTPRVRWPLQALGYDASLVAGVDVYHWQYQNRIAASVAGIDAPPHRVSADQDNRAAYLQASVAPATGTTLSAGVRRETQWIEASDAYNPAVADPLFANGALAGRQSVAAKAWTLGFRQQLAAGSAVFANAGTGFRFATVDEIYGVTADFLSEQFKFLRPQRSRSLDLGGEQSWNAFKLRANLFQVDLTDEIHLDSYTAGIGNTNLPPSRRRGLEAQAGWAVSPTFALEFNYTYTSALFLSGDFPGGAFTRLNVPLAGKTVPLVSRHRANLSANWRLEPTLLLSGNFSYASPQFMDNDEPNDLGTRIPAAFLAGAKLQWTPGPWRLALTLDNLLGHRYYTYAVRSQFTADRYNVYPLPQRVAWLSVEYTWH